MVLGRPPGRGMSGRKFNLGLMYRLHGRRRTSRLEEPSGGSSLRRPGAGTCRRLHNLGAMYYQGKGVPQDYAEAARWYWKAAEQGSVDAQFLLGFMHDKGQGVLKTPRKPSGGSTSCWLAAGHAGAQYCYLGAMFDEGRGITKDYAEAARWYRKAAEQECRRPTQARHDVKYGGKRSPDHEEAARWFRKAAEQGRAQAQVNAILPSNARAKASLKTASNPLVPQGG